MGNAHTLEFDNVTVRYPVGDGLKTVLNRVNLKVKAREFVTIVGPTGCGKSTLLRLILGAEKPTEGRMLFDGQPIDGASRDRGIVYQRYSLLPNRTVAANITLGLELDSFTISQRLFRTPAFRNSQKDFLERATRFVERIGLHRDDAAKYPHQLSGGMRQRVAIAQSLIMHPSILMMDEPFGALDDSTREDMQLFLLEQWEAAQMTIFFITHSLEEALFLGTRIIVLSPFYTDDHSNEGSKIVVDKAIPGGHPKPSDFKYTPFFNELLETIRKDGLDPEHRQHVRDFDKDHEDAVRAIPKHLGDAQ